MPATFDALVKASFCSSVKLVGTEMTAALIVLPRKSEAEDANRRMCRVVISETVTSFCLSDSVSCIENAIVESYFWG